MSEQKIVHLRYDKYIELKEKCERLEKENGTALVRIACLNAELFKMECAVNTVIKERDAAIRDMYGVEESVLYACEYCAYEHCAGDCKYFRWRGVKR